MIRIIIYYAIIVFLIVGANTGLLEYFLDSAIGIIWSKTLVDFLKQNTQGLIIILLISIYLDYIKPKEKRIEYKDIDKITKDVELVKKILEKEYFQSMDQAEALKQIIASRFPNSNHISNLSTIIAPDKPVYNDVSVNYELKDIKDDDEFYELLSRTKFKCDFDSYIIAFVNSSFLQDKLCAFCNEINDVFVFSDEETQKEYIESFADGRSSFVIVRKTKDGPTDQKTCKFRKVEISEYSRILKNIDKSEYKQIILYECNLQNDKKDALNYIVSYRYKMRKDDHYCYWVADRPIYLNNLTLDATRFSFKQHTNFVFQPFIANFNKAIDDHFAKDGYFSIDVYNWIVKGQGVFLTWR